MAGYNKYRMLHGCRRKVKTTREYRAWADMKTRCFNKNYRLFKHYGGRGITVCPLWLHDFEQFLRDLGPCPKGRSLERRNNNKNYEPDNCYWATHVQQNRNRRNAIFLTHDNQTLHIAEWAEKLDISYGTLHRRWQRHWSDKRILTTPKIDPSYGLARRWPTNSVS